MTTPSILSCCRDKAYLITNIEIIWLSNQFKGTAVFILCCITLIGIKVINLTTCIVSRNWDDGKIKITFVYIGVSNELLPTFNWYHFLLGRLLLGISMHTLNIKLKNKDAKIFRCNIVDISKILV